MIWFLGSILILVSIAAMMMVTGWCILCVLQTLRPDKAAWSLGPESLALSAFVGTAFWMLLCGPLSYLGLTFNQIRFAILPAGLLTGAFLWTKRSAYRSGKVKTRGLAAGLGLGLLPGLVSMLPLALKNSFILLGDPLTYVTIADYLGTHDFVTPVKTDVSHPYLSMVALYQGQGLRMGADFLLALVTALAFNLRAVDVYPAVLAWGMALAGLGLFLFMRWSLRSSRQIAFLALIFVALTPNTLQMSALIGFFPQTFGIAGLLFAAAILSRVVRRSTFSLEWGLLLGTAWAFLTSAYSELLPVLGIATVLTMLPGVWRSGAKKRAPRLIKTLSAAGLSWMALANVELFRFIHALPYQVKSSVGWYVAPDFPTLWSAALGAKPVEADWSWGFGLSALLLSGFFLFGLWRAMRARQLLPLAFLATFLLMAVYFGLGGNGSAPFALWPIYKITQWSTLLLVGLTFSALAGLSFVKDKIVTAAVVVLCAVGLLPLGGIFATRSAAMQVYSGSTTPIQEYFELAAMIRSYGLPVAYQVNYPGYFPAILPSYFLMDHALQGRWDGTYIQDEYWAGALPKAADTLFYCLNCPFPNPRNPLLPAQSVVIQQPVVSDIQVTSYHLVGRKLVFPITAQQAACLTVFSIRAGRARLAFSGEMKRTTARTSALKIYDNRGWQAEFELQNNKPLTLTLPLRLGANPLCFQSGSAVSATISDLYLAP